MTYENNPQLQLAFDYIHYTNQHVFLTGKAGTGKTTFLKNLKKVSPKRMVVVAPTGVAAINAGGVTIHSFFQLPFGPQIPQNIARSFNDQAPETGSADRINRFSGIKIKIIRSLDLLVIDEISMVRADMLDAIDATLRRFKNRFQPFGGVQLLMIGDLQQLAPVIKDEDWRILGKYYDTGFFFSSHALKKSEFVGIELTHIYRQKEQEFIRLLNKVRDNKLDTNDLQMLNSRYIPRFSPPQEEGYITLTTHNYQARNINDEHLLNLKGKIYRFTCKVENEFPEFSYPADEVLEIKAGAQVMFIKNDPSPDKRFYNGKIGKVTKIMDDLIEVQCPDENESIEVEPATWENTRYTLNEGTGEIEEEVIGTFTQYPLKLAWAITIHKSQGLTFEKAVIDARQSFAHGQVYVALSRCKSLEGLVLSTPLNAQSVINDETVTGFTSKVEQNQPDENILTRHRKEYELQLLSELFDFKPLIQNISYLLKYWNENSSSLIGNLQNDLSVLRKPVQEELVDVAEKFNQQIEKMTATEDNAENNILLQERIQKASNYFLAKLKEHVQGTFETLHFESDNKAVRKKVTEVLQRLESELKVKKACLLTVQEKFTIKKYLEARALASIEEPGGKMSKPKVEAKVMNSDFYMRIKQWRKQKALESGTDEIQVLHQKVMVEISAILPAGVAQLKAIKGMGGKKLKLFGQDILALVLDYRKEKGMDIPVNARKEVELASLDTKEISLTLFKQGLKPADIARERGLAASTIQGHLAHFVGLGKLDIFDVVDRKKYDIIMKQLVAKRPEETFGEIKQKLGQEYSYAEIKLVMGDMHR
jgi:energy-coupling factor transporter ATP-binding protein EcfA2